MNTRIKCKHSDSVYCIDHAFNEASRSFKFGCGIRVLINFVKFLLALTKKNRPTVLKFLSEQISIYNIRLPVSFFVCAFTLRYVVCLMRRYRQKEDNWNSLVAGLAAGFLTMLILPRQNWHFTLMIMSTRLFDGIYKLMIHHGWFSQRSINYYIIFMLGSVVLSYGYFFEPDILDPEAFNVYDRMSVLDINEKRWHIGTLTHRFYQMQKKGFKFFNKKFETLIKERLLK